jgi:hypothetical protein
VKTLREQRETKCKHFTGIQNKTCKVGIAYDSLPETEESGRTYRPLPCIDPGCSTCDKREFYTAEELDAREVEDAARFVRAAAAIEAIRADAGPYVKGQGKAGSIKCPTCGNTLNYSRAGYNGHIHARCATAGCVSFMQ